VNIATVYHFTTCQDLPDPTWGQQKHVRVEGKCV